MSKPLPSTTPRTTDLREGHTSGPRETRQELAGRRGGLLAIVAALFLGASANTLAQARLTEPFLSPPVDAGPELQLCGVGELKAFGIFTVGEGSLYRPDCKADWTVAQDEPRYMEFRYDREIPASAFRDSATNLLRKNGIEETPALEGFHAGYRDIVAGDVYAIYYAPGKGLELRLNQVVQARLADDDLAQAYFSIWLGEQPFDAELKQALLGLQRR